MNSFVHALVNMLALILLGIRAIKFALLSDDSAERIGNRAKSRTLFSPKPARSATNRRTLSHQRSHSANPASSSTATEPLLQNQQMGSDVGGNGSDAASMSNMVASTESTADPGTVSSDVRWKTSLKATRSWIDGGSQVERSADMVC